MNLAIPIISVIVAFAVIHTLNREVRPARRDIGLLHSIGIAAIVLLCIYLGFYVKVRCFDSWAFYPFIEALCAIAFILLVFQLVLALFRLLIGVSLTEQDIHICFGGDIEADRVFADTLKVSLALKAPASVYLFDIHEFERMQDAYQHSAAVGTFIYILSDKLVSDDSVRSKLLMTGQKASIPGYMYFYICHDTTYKELRESYPEMEDLGDRVMIGDDNAVKAMLEQAVAYACRRPKIMRRLRRLVAACFLPSHAGVLVGTLLPLLYGSAPIVWLLLFASASAPCIRAMVPDFLLAVAACQFVALLIHRQRAFDFWPFLGSRLNCTLSTHACAQQSTWMRSVLGFWAWSDDTHARNKKEVHEERCLTSEQSLHSLRAWSGLIMESRLYTLTVLFAGGFAVFLCSRNIPHAEILVLLGGMLGLALPPWVAWSQRLVKHIGYWRLGLTSSELDRTATFFRIDSLNDRFIGNLSYLSHKMLRSWLRQKPRVFISYSWTADEKRGLAPTVHQTLKKLGIDHFYDKNNIRSEFAAWRASVSDALTSCTHVLLLLDDSMPANQVVDREIRTAVQRLHTDIFPSFICVAEPQTVASLLAKEDIPFELRWLLEWTPCISPQEATCSHILEAVIRQRTRQGRLADFATMLFPGKYMKLFLSRYQVPVSTNDLGMSNEQDKPSVRGRLRR